MVFRVQISLASLRCKSVEVNQLFPAPFSIFWHENSNLSYPPVPAHPGLIYGNGSLARAVLEQCLIPLCPANLVTQTPLLDLRPELKLFVGLHAVLPGSCGLPVPSSLTLDTSCRLCIAWQRSSSPSPTSLALLDIFYLLCSPCLCVTHPEP